MNIGIDFSQVDTKPFDLMAGKLAELVIAVFVIGILMVIASLFRFPRPLILALALIGIFGFFIFWFIKNI